MKVAIYSGVSTSTTFIERLIKGLTENNVRVFIFGTKNGVTKSSKLLKYHCYSHKINKGIRLVKYSFLLTLFNIKEKKKLDNIIRENKKESNRLLKLKYYPVLYYKPEIFHLQWAKSIKDWIWVEEFGIKLIVSLRGTHITISPKINPYYKDLYLKLFPKVSAFHAVSESTAKEAEKYNVLPSKIYVIKSGLPINELKFQQNKKRNKPLKILSVGRPHFVKGYNLALDAMAILKEKKANFKYTIIGVLGDEKLMYQYHQLKLQNDVILKSVMPFEAIKQEMFSSDIVLLPSIEEGIANVVLEAMTLGTLVIGSDCGGMNEVIINNQTGFLFKSRDINEMANTILQLNNLPQSQYNEIVRNARLKIEEEHSVNTMISGMLNLYKDTANQ